MSDCKANWDLNSCISVESNRMRSPFKDGYFDCTATTIKPAKINGALPPDFNLGKFD